MAVSDVVARRPVESYGLRPAAGDLARVGGWLLLVTGLGIAIGALATGPLVGPVSRHLDQPVTAFVLSHPSTFWAGVLERVETLGTLWGAAALAVTVGLAFAFVARSREPLYQCALAIGGAALITVAVRAVVSRPAQDGPVKGFPSGHALLAVAVCGTAAVLAMRTIEHRRLRLAATIGFVVLGAAVAWARVYRLDHVATDVLGSLVLGIAWVLAIARVAGRREARGRGRSYFSASSRL